MAGLRLLHRVHGQRSGSHWPCGRGAGIDLRLEDARRRSQRLDVAGDQVGHGRPRPAIGDVVHPEAGIGVEHLHGDVECAVRARRTVGNLSRPRPGVGGEFRDILPRRAGVDGEQGRIGQHPRDGNELVDLVLRLTPHDAVRLRQHGQRGQGHQQCMAVGIGFRDGGIAERAAGTAAIVHDDGLAEQLLQRLGDRSGGEIPLPARRKRHDHADVLRGPGGLADGGRGKPRRAKSSRTKSGRSGQEEPSVEFSLGHRVPPSDSCH
jgi:hypothetical protein